MVLPRALTTIIAFFVSMCALPIQARASHKIGDVNVILTGSLYEEFNDNITYTPNNTKKDYVTGTKVGFAAGYEGKLQNFSLSGNVNHQLFASNTKFNNFSEDVTGSYSRELSKFDRMSFSDSFVHAEEPTSFDDEFGRTSGRYSYYRNRLNFDYTRELTRQLSLKTGYTNELTSYSREDLANSTQHRGALDALFSISSQDTIIAGYEHLDKKYKGGANFKTDRVTAGLRHYFTSQLSFNGRIGQDFVKSSGSSKSNRENYISASLTDEIDAKTSASISFTKEGGATSSTQALRKSWQTALTLSKQFFARLVGGISAFYGQGDYDSLSIKDTFKGTNASLQYELARNLTASLTYSFSDLSSNVATREYTVNRVMLGLRYDF